MAKKPLTTEDQERLLAEEEEIFDDLSFYQYLKQKVFSEELLLDELHKPEGSGRRRKYNNVKDFTMAIIKGLNHLYRQNRVISIYGVAEYMGLCDDHTLNNYAEYSEDYANVLRKLKNICKTYALDLGKTPSGKFAQFLLQNLGFSTNAIVTQINKTVTVGISGLERKDN